MEQEKKENLDRSYSEEEVRGLTPQEEAAILTKFKAEIDPVAMEAECRELLRQRERGELISAEQLMEELYGKDWQEKKEPA